jgi:hypothetical protein
MIGIKITKKKKNKQFSEFLGSRFWGRQLRHGMIYLFFLDFEFDFLKFGTCIPLDLITSTTGKNRE